MTLRRGLIAQALLAVGLWAAVAYSLWRWPTRPESRARAPLLACRVPDRLSATLATAAGRYQLSESGAGPRGRRWVIIERDSSGRTGEASRPPQAGLDGAKSVHPELMAMIGQLPSREQFSANAAADAWARDLVDLPIERELGAMADGRLAAFGLGAAEAWTLTVACGGQRDVFEVGAAVDGTGQRYLRRHGQGSVLMAQGALFSQLQSARFSFMLKALLSVALPEVSTLSWTVGEQVVTLVREPKGSWHLQGDAQKLPGFGRWLTRVTGLPVRSFLPQNRAPQPPTGGPALQLTFWAGSRRLGALRWQSAAGATLEFFGQSSDTGGWVQLYSQAAAAAWQEMAHWSRLPHPEKGARRQDLPADVP